MYNGMLEATRGCLKETMKIDIISNNLANSSAIGFKKDRISFQELLGKTGGGSSDSPDKAKFVTVRPDFNQGDTRATGNALDLSVHGRGFFKVSTENGMRFTRKGNFHPDPSGVLRTQNGGQVMGKKGPIKIEGTDIAINDNGFIFVDGIEVGQLDTVDFDDYENLIKEGNGYFQHRYDDPGKAVSADTEIQQGYLELSNVNIAEEMVNMIHSHRAFESYQKTIRILDEINEKAVNQVGKLR